MDAERKDIPLMRRRQRTDDSEDGVSDERWGVQHMGAICRLIHMFCHDVKQGWRCLWLKIRPYSELNCHQSSNEYKSFSGVST